MRQPTSIVCVSLFLLGLVNAQTPPEVVIMPPAACGGMTSGDLPLVYELVDDQGDLCTILVELTTDSGATWALATESMDPGSEGTTGLASAPSPGVTHQFIWDSRADLGMGFYPGVMVKITPDDGTSALPTPMGIAGTYMWPDTTERLQWLSVSNDRLYASTRQTPWGSASTGVMLDLVMPATPTLAAETASLGTTVVSALADGELFVTGQRFGQITVFDALAVTTPVPATGFVNTIYEAGDCFDFAGEWLFYAEQEASSQPSGIHIFDVNRMTRALTWLGSSVSTQRDAVSIAVRPPGDFAYTGDAGCRPGLGCGNANLYQIWAYDTQTKSAPFVASSGHLMGDEIRIQQMSVTDNGNTLIVTGRHHNGAAYYDPPVQLDGLILFDLSIDPANPMLLGNVPFDGYYHAYDPTADIVYVTDDVTDDLIAFDISLPAAPVEVDRLTGTNAFFVTCAPNGHVYYTGKDIGVDGHIVTAVTKYTTGVTPAADTTCALDIDNSQLCALCGDCDLNGLGPSILDALVGAQVAAGIIVPSAAQAACCDVDSSGVVNVLDALVMAQAAAGLMSTLTCL